jgi:hypothetical protein
MRDRLRTVLPRLQQRYQEVVAQEYLGQWEKDYEAVKVEHDALAVEFREVYRQVAAKLVDLLTRVTACDRECHRVNVSAPAGEPRRLAGAEWAARGLEGLVVFCRDPSPRRGGFSPESSRAVTRPARRLRANFSHRQWIMISTHSRRRLGHASPLGRTE